MQFDYSTDDGTDEESTDPVAPGTSCCSVRLTGVICHQ